MSQTRMSSTQDTFENYITKTLSAEQQKAVDAAAEKVAVQEEYDRELRANLQAALDRDDKKAAIKLAFELIEDDGEDHEIDKLYNFLLSRVGVPRREPFFAMSLQPVVQWASAICVTVPVIFLISYLLAPSQEPVAAQTDVLSCLGAAVIFGIPLWDVLFAAGYNFVNRYRLTDNVAG